MTITSKGYAGAILTPDYARMSQEWGTSYGVQGEDDWRPGVTSAVARGVTVGLGIGFGCGVEDTISGEPVQLSAAAVASGTRYDTLVARRTWSSSTTTFALVQGGTTPVLAAARVTGPGVVDEQPLAIYAITGSTATLVADLRVWHGDGGLLAVDAAATSYITGLGSRVWVGDREYVRVRGAGGVPTWIVNLQTPSLSRRGWISPVPRTNYDLWPGNQNGNMAICTVMGAPAGTYLLSGRCEVSPQATLDSEQAFLTRYLANGALVANREYGTVVGAGRYRSETAPAVPHYHPGGNLTVILQARCAVVCAVRRAEVTVSYLGPAEG